MTTALPAAQATSAGSPLPGIRHLRLVDGAAPHGTAQPDSPPLVGYLLLVPEGTDPARLFAEGVPRPEIRPITGPVTSPVAGPVPAPVTEPGRQPAAGGVRIDPERHAAELDGHELDLTYLEFGLLAHLVRHPHQVHSRERLTAAVWGYDHIGDGRTVDVHIARLRRKLGTAHRHRIVTVRRVGYKYVPDTAARRRS
jgi:DNA-binding winged helix-turn-helix (wHTH) protein